MTTELLTHTKVYGDPDRLHLAPTAVVNNALFNLASGHIYVGEFAMLAHDTCLLTGTHDVTKFGAERQVAVPPSGRDIHVESGAWVASCAIVLGPCTIGRNAVVAAGSLVRGDVAPHTIVAGVPARVVGVIPE